MAQEPANPRLWKMFVVQAHAKFEKWPSLAASKWVHEKYVQAGGKFIDPADRKRQVLAAKQFGNRDDNEDAKNGAKDDKKHKGKNHK